MGVYHSHSIQIARLIERAHSFARPPSATPLRLNVSQASSHLVGARHLCFLNLRQSSTNEFPHRIIGFVFLREQIAFRDNVMSRKARVIFYRCKYKIKFFLTKVKRYHLSFNINFYIIKLYILTIKFRIRNP